MSAFVLLGGFSPFWDILFPKTVKSCHGDTFKLTDCLMVFYIPTTVGDIKMHGILARGKEFKALRQPN